MKFGRWLIPAVCSFTAFSYSYSAQAYQNVCPYSGQARNQIAQTFNVVPESVAQMAASYCANIGLSAYNAIGTDRIRAIYLGPIIGVTWINSGDVISEPEGPPRRSQISGFMYIIGPGGVSNRVFYRWGTDVLGRPAFPTASTASSGAMAERP